MMMLECLMRPPSLMKSSMMAEMIAMLSMVVMNHDTKLTPVRSPITRRICGQNQQNFVF